MSPSSPDGSYGSPGSPGSPGSDAMFDNDVVLDVFDPGKEDAVVGVCVLNGYDSWTKEGEFVVL